MRSHSISLAVCLTAACLLWGCPDPDPADDAGVPEDAGSELRDAGEDGHDAAVGDDAAVHADAAVEECDVAGTYEVTWTPATGNAEDCPATLDDTIEIDAEGFDPGSPTCPADCSTTCTRVPVSPGACMSSAEISGPCAGLPEGRTISTIITFGETEAAFSVTDTMNPAASGVCAFTGIGVRR